MERPFFRRYPFSYYLMGAILEIAAKLQPVLQGVNLFKIPLTIPQPRRWSPEAPWLYQIQAKLVDENGQVVDAAKRQFGLRTFRMEYLNEPKGRMYLNGQGIKLRGANTMRALQQCVIRKDWRQLIDDILLAKITHMNYMRLTQMPVQAQIYDYCDRLGLMVQTDLPLFGCVRRNQFCEAVRQAGEMERLVRSHPSNTLVTYINEPFPNSMDAPQRNLTREEMTRLFESADMTVRLANPDRVISLNYDLETLGYATTYYWMIVTPGTTIVFRPLGQYGVSPLRHHLVAAVVEGEAVMVA